MKTKVLTKTLVPVWEEAFEIAEYRRGEVVEFAVFDHDKVGSADSLGHVSVPGEALRGSGFFEGELKLEDAGKGIEAFLKHDRRDLARPFVPKVKNPEQQANYYARMGMDEEAQAAYESLIADTNNAVAALMEEVVTKSKNKAKATKDLIQTDSDISDTQKEIDGLNKENADLHAECDYVLKNFDVRQKARGEEIEALQQAKQILSGASLS